MPMVGLTRLSRVQLTDLPGYLSHIGFGWETVGTKVWRFGGGVLD